MNKRILSEFRKLMATDIAKGDMEEGFFDDEAGDGEWFREHPNAAERSRKPTPGELAHFNLKPDDNVVIQFIAPGIMGKMLPTGALKRRASSEGPNTKLHQERQ